MKKYSKLILTSTCLLALLSSCGTNTNSSSTNVPNSSGTSSSLSTTSSIVEKFTVSFYVDEKIYDTKQIAAGDTMTFPTNPSKSGAQFVGWYTSKLCEENTKVNDNTIVKDNMTLYAGFVDEAPKTITINFDANGGKLSGPATVSVLVGNKLPKPADPSFSGYEFLGWTKVKDSVEFYNFDTNIDSAFTLYAKWEQVIINSKYQSITATSTNGIHIASSAADDNVDTYWEAEEHGEQELLVDLGKVKQVTQVKQQFNDASSWTFIIAGSLDGEIYLPLLAVENQSGASFESLANGFYRYIKLTIAANDAGEKASSIAFDIDSIDLSAGINIASHFKGLADCHAGGYESEKLFDGDINTLHIPNSDHVGHYAGMETINPVFVKNVELSMADPVAYSFKLDYKNINGEWILPANGDFSSNQTNSSHYQIDVNDLASAVLYHQEAINSNWHGIKEMTVNGFEILKATNTVQDGKDVYDFGRLTYINRVAIADKTQTNSVIEVSVDGDKWTAIDKTKIEGDYYIVDEIVRYVRYSDNQATLNPGQLTIVGISLLRNIAMDSSVSIDIPNSNPQYSPYMAILNPNCKNASAMMFCAENYEQQEIMEIEFGNTALVESVSLKVNDNQTSETLKFKIEGKLPDGTYVTLRDTTDAPVSGQYVNVDEIPESAQYLTGLKITFQILQTWTNLNSVVINGYGSIK